MSESDPILHPDGQDPTLGSLNDVIETLTGQPVPRETTEALGAAGTGAAVAAAGAISGESAVGSEETAPESAVKHERPKPAHWDELVEFAGTLPIYAYAPSVDEDYKYEPHYVDASVDALRAKMEELLSDEELDECRYYSIGTLLCGIAQGIRDPERRPDILAGVAERIKTHWNMEGSADPRGLMPGDISGFRPSSPFRRFIDEFGAALPPPVQLLNDLLDWHVAERKFANKNGSSPTDFTFLSRSGPPEDRHYKAGAGPRRAGEQAAVATARVLRHVLTLRAEYLARTDPECPANPTVTQIMERTDMDDINLIPVAQRAAAMRLDEFRNLEEGQYITLDEQGRAVFNGKKLPRAKDLVPTPPSQELGAPMLLHTRRLRCPALFVEGLIPGMMDCLIEGAKLADARIAEERERVKSWY